jgi:hypothetical protein
MMRIQSPLEFPNAHPCLKIQQAELLEDERLPDLVALGMPPEDHIRLTIKGEFFDADFADYVLELYGFWPEDLEPNRRDQRFGSPPYTRVHYPSAASGCTFKEHYYFWLLRVRRTGETVSELIWHPDVLDYLSFMRNVWVVYSEPARALIGHIEKRSQRGRREGTGYFEGNNNFIKALRDVLKDKDASLSVAQGLFYLSQHRLWQGEPLTVKGCQLRRKTLRNWLARCELTWAQAKQKYCKPSKKR